MINTRTNLGVVVRHNCNTDELSTYEHGQRRLRMKKQRSASACKALAHSWHAERHKPRSVVLALFSHCTIALH